MLRATERPRAVPSLSSGAVWYDTCGCDGNSPFVMEIKTGKGTIPLVVLLAIWSVSAISSLPGLAVSPVLGDLNRIFPKATDLEIQMLTSLPTKRIV